MFYQILLLSQVKRWAIITYKHGIYELPHKFPNDLRLNIRNPHGILTAGGGSAHTRKEKRLNIRKVFKLDRMTA